jgi:hypothetical protein
VDVLQTPPRKKPLEKAPGPPLKDGEKQPIVLNRHLYDVRVDIHNKKSDKRPTYDGNPGIKDDKPLDAAYTDGYNDAIAGKFSRFHYSDMTQPGEEIKNKDYIDNYKKGYDYGKLQGNYEADDEAKEGDE